ncbi:MAG: ABC transporter substrate-binding protein, partial [Candidatus Heimdallarchaeota archaeon]
MKKHLLLFMITFTSLCFSLNIEFCSTNEITSVSFEIGISSGPGDIDPQKTWDSVGIDVIDQVCEGLFAHDLSDPELKPIPRLASDYGMWDPTTTEYTVSLKQGIVFHDGTPFNANAVNFTWQRLAWALNTTGTNFDEITIFHFVYEFFDGIPIVNRTKINSAYNVTFILNRPFAAFEALLCFEGSYFTSPTSTNATEYIDINDGDLLGTGPFVYDSYIPGYELTFHAFEDYWREIASIKSLVFSIISSPPNLNDALINGNIHFLDRPQFSMLDTFKSTLSLRVLDEGLTDTSMFFVGMNTIQINRTFRNVISYSVNYSYIINKITDDSSKKLNSPIPDGVTYANNTFQAPDFNITRARTLMQSMGFGVAWDPTYLGANEINWVNATFFSFNFTYVTSIHGGEIFQVLENGLDLIGMQLTDEAVTYLDFIEKVTEADGDRRNELQLYFMGWGPDINDPSCIIDPFFSNVTINQNGAQYNGFQEAQQAGRDPYNLWDNVQLLMEEALVEIDPILRRSMYNRIQELIIDDAPLILLYSPKLYNAYHRSLIGFQQNAMNTLDFYSCTWPIIPITIIGGPFEFLFYITLAGLLIYVVSTIKYINLNKIRTKKAMKKRRELFNSKKTSDQDLFNTYIKKQEAITTTPENLQKIGDMLRVDKDQIIKIEISPLEFQQEFIKDSGESKEFIINSF